MIVRIITALIGIPIGLLLMYWGNTSLLGIVLLLTILGLKEYESIVFKIGAEDFPRIFYLFAILFPISAYFNISLDTVIVMTLLLTMIIALIRKFQNVMHYALGIIGVFYIALTLSYIIKIRMLPDGFKLLVFTFLLIWMTDSAAYFSGRLFGKRKLAPFISPKKTIEGSLGSLIFTLLLGIVMSKFWTLSLIHSVFLALIVNIFSQTGDLVESAIKRQAHLKDSGSLLPGHGGVLDRFDSTFFVMPIVYFYISLIISR